MKPIQTKIKKKAFKQFECQGRLVTLCAMCPSHITQEMVDELLITMPTTVEDTFDDNYEAIQVIITLSVCNPSDAPSKSLGIKIAEDRATKFFKEGRECAIAYFETVPTVCNMSSLLEHLAETIVRFPDKFLYLPN